MDTKKASIVDMMLNFHFMSKQMKFIQQQEEKEVFLANGYTQRN